MDNRNIILIFVPNQLNKSTMVKKTRRELAQEQLDLANKMRDNGINMVTCGNCGTILLHETKTINEIVDEDLHIECFGCKREMAFSDCPDYWYEGCIENSEFDEDEEDNGFTKAIGVADVISVAESLKMNPSITQIHEVLLRYDNEVEEDPSGCLPLWVEKLLYEIIDEEKDSTEFIRK